MAAKPTYEDLEKRVQELERADSERKKAEEALESERAFLSAVFDNIAEAIVTCDKEGRLARFNEAARRLHGLPAQPIPPDQWTEHYDLYRADGVTPLPVEEIPLFRALKGERVQNAEIVVDPKHDQPRSLVCNGQALTDESGRIMGAVVAMHDITERKNAEVLLRESEKRFEKMLNVVPDMISVHSPHMDILYSNWAGFGAVPESKRILNTKCYRTYRGLDDICPDCRARSVLDSRRPFQEDVRLPDGTWVDLRVIPILDDDDHVEMFMEWVRDITEYQQAMEALQESELKHRTLFENANEAIFVVQDRRLVFLNPKTMELTGYSDEELRERPFIEFIHPEDKELVMNRHVSRLKGEDIPPVYSFRIVRKDGSILWVELSAVVITWNGKTATLNFFSDVTERKRFEEALQASEQRYRKILESIVDGYYEVDLSGSFLFFNDSACDLLGYARDELLGMNYRQYTDETNATALYQVFNGVYRTGRATKGFDWEVIRKDRTTRSVEASVTLIKDAQGNPSGFRGIVRDITDRKHMEAEQENLRQKLQQAQKMESIGTLAGGIAHNFNNVLMGIQGRASLMMMDKAPSSPDYEHLKGIEEYVVSATELTRALLGFARGGKYEVRTTNLNELIQHENRMFAQTKKEIRIQETYQDDLWTVEVDQDQMRQVFLNLYVNAWQAMPGGGDLHVRTGNVTLDEETVKPFELDIAPGRYVKVSVTDTGVGMDSTTRERVFDPFFSTKEKGQGSGLGLASVYGIIKNHGGYIHVDSEKGKGATFTLYLPASQKEALVGMEGSDRHEIQHGRGTVLLVDDEGMIIEVGRRMLEKLGYRVLVAGSGPEALDLYAAQTQEIDLVILDMIMPGMGGGETYERLKEIDGKVRVLLSSGYSLDGQAKEILDRGCRSFIQKPFDLVKLSQKVREALEE